MENENGDSILHSNMRRAEDRAKHTPGPWKIQDEYDGTLPIDGWSEDAEESCEICRVSLDMLTEGERIANARLIAAAPDLLSALEKCALFISGLHDGTRPSVEVWKAAFEPLKEARAAIAKAKGE